MCHTGVIIQMYVLICHKNIHTHTHTHTHTLYSVLSTFFFKEFNTLSKVALNRSKGTFYFFKHSIQSWHFFVFFFFTNELDVLTVFNTDYNCSCWWHALPNSIRADLQKRLKTSLPSTLDPPTQDTSIVFPLNLLLFFVFIKNKTKKHCYMYCYGRTSHNTYIVALCGFASIALILSPFG